METPTKSRASHQGRPKPHVGKFAQVAAYTGSQLQRRRHDGSWQFRGLSASSCAANVPADESRDRKANAHHKESNDQIGLQTYDFAWLLERIADFGAEAPPSYISMWRPNEIAPNPLKLLVPETITFDPEAGVHPKSIFFTDAGGFLRAACKPLHDESSSVFQALTKLARQRSQSNREYLAETSVAREYDWGSSGSGLGVTGSTLGGDSMNATAEHRPATTEFQSRLPQAPLERDSTLPGLLAAPDASPIGKAELMPSMVHLPSGTKRRRSSVGDGSIKQDSSRKGVGCPLNLQRSRGGAEKLAVISDYTHYWRVAMKNGQEVASTDVDAYATIRNVSDKQSTRLLGVKFIQVCAWPARERPDDASSVQGRGCSGFSYHYDAFKRQEGNRRLNSRFERANVTQIMETVADKNLVSSLPIIISQHLAYRCRLEILSGDFEFVRDHLGQIWFVDARELHVVKKEDNPKKTLNRYLSEEALSNMPLAEEDGERLENMCGKMATYCKSMWETCGVDAFLRKASQDMDVCVPVLEGMDPKVAMRYFADTTSGQETAAAAQGTSVAHRQESGRQPVKPNTSGASPLTPRSPFSPRHPNALARRATALKAGGGHPLWPTVPWQEDATALASEQSEAVQCRMLAAPSALVERPSNVNSCASSRRVSSNLGGEVELSLSEEAARLLERTGLGLRPRGDCLDEIGPPSIQAPGSGLLAMQANDKPRLRLVQVPTGAASVVVQTKYGASSGTSGSPRATLESGKVAAVAIAARDPPSRRPASARRFSACGSGGDGVGDRLFSVSEFMKATVSPRISGYVQ